MKNFVFPRMAVLFVAGIGIMAIPNILIADAVPITLAWNPANDSSVSGYAIYYGLANQPATNRFNAGTNTVATLYGLQASVSYRIFAVSYNVLGQESVPSNQLMLTPPALSRLQLVRQSNGNMQLSGRAAPGTVCVIQFSPTLQPASWQTLKTVTADASGNVMTSDTTANQATRRFYRMALP